MTEQTVLAATVMAGVMLSTFVWVLNRGWSEDAARNALLLLGVLFQNVHVGNSRSETKSAFAISPLRSPLLFGGVAVALLVHLAAMHTALGQRVLKTQSVDHITWAALIGLSLTVVIDGATQADLGLASEVGPRSVSKLRARR